MPQIVFSEKEKAAMEVVIAEFDPEYHQLTKGLKAILPEDDWRFVVESLRKTLRREVEGALARPVVDDAVTYYESQADPEDMYRMYKLIFSTEAFHPLPGEWNRTWGHSPLAAASNRLIDEAEEAVKERVAAA
jgi:hypothetical protein